MTQKQIHDKYVRELGELIDNRDREFISNEQYETEARALREWYLQALEGIKNGKG